MASVTIRIEPEGAGESDFLVHLIEQDGTRTSAPLLRADLTTGPWTANLDAASPPPASDIVTNVADTTQNGHDDPRYGQIGQRLYRWLLPIGPVRERWLALNKPRIYVDARFDALERLPWELARAELPPVIRPALINGIYRLAHRAASVMAADMRGSAWPFRILVLIGCAEVEEPGLHVDEEVKAIERNFHPLGRTVDVHCMYRPTKAEMMDWITRFHPHVFHFAGHGAKLPGQEQYGLQIESKTGTWIWTSDAIDNDLPAKHWTPQFVFLNACRSAAERSGSWSTHHSFLAAGARAVLGMQADMRGDLSGKLASALYQSLAEGEPLDGAMHLARSSIADELPALDYVDWALPAITVTEPELKLFEPRRPPSDETFESCGEFEEARFFANCREPRRIFTDWVYPCAASKKVKNVLLVVGERNSGKSHLLKWCMENWVIAGARVRYIRLHDGTPKTFLSVLRQIRDGEADENDIRTHYLHAGLAKQAFRRFNWELNNLIRAGAPGEWVEAEHPEAEITDDCQPLTARGEKRLENEIGAAFVEALKLVAQTNPLVIVFDQLEGPKGESLLPADQSEQLVRNLFRPLSELAHPAIKIVISATSAEVTDHKLSLLPEQCVNKYQVPTDIPVADLIAFAAEMMWFKDEANVRGVAGLLLQYQLGEPVPKGMARLVAVKQSMAQIPVILSAVERMR